MATGPIDGPIVGHVNKGNGGEPRRLKAVRIGLTLVGALLTTGLLWSVVWWGLGWHSPVFWAIAAKLSFKAGILVLVGLVAVLAVLMGAIARIGAKVGERIGAWIGARFRS